MVPEAPFTKPRSLYPDLAEVRIPAAGSAAHGDAFRRGGVGAGALDDQSCSVLQMAKTLSDSEFPGQPPRAPSAPPPLRGQPMGLGLDACRTFPPRNPITESIAEDMPEEVSSSWEVILFSVKQFQRLEEAMLCVLRSFLSGDSSFCAVSHKNTNIFNFDVKYQSLLL